MSNQIKDGGPAFPVSTSNPSDGHQDGNGTWAFPGLSKRDYFAAAAMTGIAASSNGLFGSNFKDTDTAFGCAILAFRLADAMIAESEKTK